MLAKLNHYRSTWNLPLIGTKNMSSHFRFEWVDDLKQLQQVQQFRAKQFAQQFAIEFEGGLDQDLYDFSCEHAVLKDKSTGQIVAYTRLKKFQGHELAQSYSATEFEIFPHLAHLSNIVEVGRTCVHPKFRSGHALSVLWLNLLPKVLWGMRAKSLIGCVSIRLDDNLARAYYTHAYLQHLDARQSIDICSKQPYVPQRPSHSFSQDEKIPKLFKSYLNMQARLSKQAFYDETFKCLDYFVYLEVNQIAKNFVLNKKLLR